MADLRSGLEAELARQLAPVSAPDSLWSRIHEQRRPLRVRPQPWRVWSIAAATLLLLLAGFAWRARASRGPVGPIEAAREVRALRVRAGADVQKNTDRTCLLCHVNAPALMVQ